MPQPDPQTRHRVQRVLRRMIEPARRPRVAPVAIEAHHVRGEPITVEEAMQRPFEPFAVGDAWGPRWDTTWFRVTGSVPEDWAGEDVRLSVHLGYALATGFGAEGLVWIDGEPRQGISPNHADVRLFDGPATGGATFELYIEAAANPQADPKPDPSPMLLADPEGRPQQRLTTCHLATVDHEVEALWHDWALLTELYDELDASTPRAAQILHGLDRASNVIDPTDVAGSALAAREILRPLLDKPAHASAHHYLAIGNAHIDTAWLWPLRETKRKVARTFSTAVTLMESNPDYRFAASQAVQLAWVRDEYPALWERIRKYVAEGQFEVVGSMWVEADCNVPSGESLVRQIVHGKRFFLDELGVETNGLWLPDVFGYAAGLPQILAKAGIEWFLTQKISWNQVNKFPHHTFWWEGIDGTRIFSHFPPADTYVGDFTVKQLAYGERNFAQRALCDRSTYLYGWGDGGGGPTIEMLERARRVADLEGHPRVDLSGAEEAFAALREEAPLDELPVWVGELYLEMHRGTYTTHAAVKEGNRRIEGALRDVELWSAAAQALTGADYPHDDLDEAWKRFLVHQFHDIIPGSSIHWVYRDTHADYAQLRAQTSDLIDTALSRLAARVEAGGASAPALVANPLSFPRRELVEVDGRLVMVEAPACGWAVNDLAAAISDDAPPPVQSGDGFIDNGVLRIEWDGDGLLTSVRHHASEREVIAPGRRGNLLQLHDDRPNVYDAWDIDAVAFDTVIDLTHADTVELAEVTDDRATLRVVRTFGSSRIEQLVRLARGAERLDITCHVDWHEDHKLLKVAFPVDVHSPQATYEVQYGHVQRPTHANTSWDAARFEVCAQTWVDLSEHGFGVALLNDCKYGHDVRGNVLRLSLLRSPTFPDPVADRGEHTFTYSLYPHTGEGPAAGVIAQAHALNAPLRIVEIDTSAERGAANSDPNVPAVLSMVEIDDPAAIVTAVKQADDGDGTVVRLYEAFGGQRTVRVRLHGATAVERVDLLERTLPGGSASDGNAPLALDGDIVRLTLRPFELVTLRYR